MQNSKEYNEFLANEAIEIKKLQEKYGDNAYHEGKYWPSYCSKTSIRGDLEFRFCWLMDELNNRFPGVNDPLMSYSHEGRIIDALDKLIKQNKEYRLMLLDLNRNHYYKDNWVSW